MKIRPCGAVEPAAGAEDCAVAGPASEKSAAVAVAAASMPRGVRRVMGSSEGVKAWCGRGVSGAGVILTHRPPA
ncbi:hypothetical protein Slala04_68570 [Streptomyces lavendulae subsp. lavendulae]|nr:hypothetical protein Slala04_68570 [Streptomyces lavendulae subsp. lavendulae]